jgi:hypothetical protein
MSKKRRKWLQNCDIYAPNIGPTCKRIRTHVNIFLVSRRNKGKSQNNYSLGHRMNMPETQKKGKFYNVNGTYNLTST